MPKLTVTLTMTYDANPAHYENKDLPGMAKIDEENFRNQPDALMELFSSGLAEDVRVTVKPGPT